MTVSIIPAGRFWTVPPIHGFTLLDGRIVTVDLFSNGLTADDEANGRFYRDVFDALRKLSVDDVGDMLDGYIDRYLDEARNRRRG